MRKPNPKWYFTSPMPATLDDAMDEIARLRQQLHDQNVKLAAMHEKKELQRRSLLGMIKTMEKRFGIRVNADGNLPQGTAELKTDDGQTIRIINVGVDEAYESTQSA